MPRALEEIVMAEISEHAESCSPTTKSISPLPPMPMASKLGRMVTEREESHSQSHMIL